MPISQDATLVAITGDDGTTVVNIVTTGGVDRLAVDALVIAGGVFDEDTDDGTIAANQTLLLAIQLLYGFESGAGTWGRVQLEVEDDSIPASETHLTTIDLLYGFDGAAWERLITDGSGRLIVVGPGGGGASSVEILRVVQVENVETTAALGSGGSFTSTGRDLINYQGFGVSVFVTAGAGSLDVDVLVENSQDNITYREVETVNLTGGVGTSASFNRVYDTTRQFYRVTLTNNDGANALATTELMTLQKPI